MEFLISAATFFFFGQIVKDQNQTGSAFPTSQSLTAPSTWTFNDTKFLLYRAAAADKWLMWQAGYGPCQWDAALLITIQKLIKEVLAFLIDMTSIIANIGIMMAVSNGKANVGGEKPIVWKCFHFLIFKPFPPCTYYLVLSVIGGNGQRTERAKSTTARKRSLCTDCDFGHFWLWSRPILPNLAPTQ